MQFVDEPVAVI